MAGERLEEKTWENYYESFKPFRIWRVSELEIQAPSGIVAEIDAQGNKKILFSKNSLSLLPIASLTKLMTAYLALENYSLEQKVKMSANAAFKEGGTGYFKPGETFYAKDLLYSLLMESSNEAAQALGEIMGEEKFVGAMNAKARELNLNIYFFNPTGLDPDEPNTMVNRSNAEDLASLGWHVSQKPLLAEILKTEELDLYTASGVFHHKIKNSNKFLESGNNFWWKPGMLGGKTGWTPMAGECFLLLLENTKNNTLLAAVVLGAEDRFEDMEKMINWIYKAYKW